MSNELILSKKVAILGYGNQGRAQALNLRDSGVHVLIGQREGKGFERAVEDGFAPTSIPIAVMEADVMMLTLPDELMGRIYRDEIRDHLKPGQTMLFSHGFAIHYEQIVPPAFVDVALVSPKGQAAGVRGMYEQGSGVPALIGVHQGDARPMAMSYAWACGYTQSLIVETTFKEETETDLFGEQAVLCGGMIEIIKAGFQTLVEAGYSEEAAYFECVHETKLIIDLLVAKGLGEMRAAISDTAEYGGYLAGPRLVTDKTRQEMRDILSAIQTGEFAGRWVAEASLGKKNMLKDREAEANSGLDRAGNRIRAHISHKP